FSSSPSSVLSSFSTLFFFFFFLIIPRPPCSTLFPYTTLFRSDRRRRDFALLWLGLLLRLGHGAHSRSMMTVAPAWRVSAMAQTQDRKSTRLNSSHVAISYAVFCLKKKNKECASVKSS